MFSIDNFVCVYLALKLCAQRFHLLQRFTCFPEPELIMFFRMILVRAFFCIKLFFVYL
jgi:hypothetical protein